MLVDPIFADRLQGTPGVVDTALLVDDSSIGRGRTGTKARGPGRWKEDY
jgi:hypothetical protein